MFRTDVTTRLRLAMLGDSIAFGTGADRVEDRLGPRLAAELAREGIDVELSVLAKPGATSKGLAAQVQAAELIRPEIAVIVVGANDLSRFVPSDRAAKLLGAAVAGLRRLDADVVVSTAPDLSAVPGCPPEAGDYVRQACEDLAAAQAVATEAADGIAAPLGGELGRVFARNPDSFAADGYHPSSAGYARIAERLTPYVLGVARRRLEQSAA